MSHSWNLHFCLFAFSMLMCPPVPTSSVEHTSSCILVPPVLPFPTTRPPFPSPSSPIPTAPISVCRHAPVSPIRKGNEARIQMQIY